MRVDWAGDYDYISSLVCDQSRSASQRDTTEFQTLERDLTELKAKALDHIERIWVPGATVENSRNTEKPSLSMVDCSAMTTSTQIIVAFRGQNLVNPGIAFVGKVVSMNVESISAQFCLASFPPTLRASPDLKNADVKLYCEAGTAIKTVKLDIPPPADYNDGVLPLPTPTPNAEGKQ
jgi:hypothetical protein